MKYSDRRENEAVMQAKLYSKLTSLGYNCDLEYPISKKDHKKLTKSCKLDLIIHNEGKIELIVELKSRKNDRYKFCKFVDESDLKRSRQLFKYSLLGVPIFYLSDCELVEKAVEMIHSRFYHLTEKDPPVEKKQRKRSFTESLLLGDI